MVKYTVLKGKHAFRLLGGLLPPPVVIRRDIDQISWVVWFDENCDYILPGREWEDWNKGGGVSCDLLANHTDSAMWGWRKNPNTKMIELTAYCHIDGDRPVLRSSLYAQKHSNVGGEVCLEVKHKQYVRISMQIDRQEKRYDFNFMVIDSSESWPVGVPFNHDKRLGRIINGWFGGQNDETKEPTKAPHRMDIKMKIRFSSK